jgi:hypothetical protein
MRQAPHRAALAPEPLEAARAEERGVQQLDRDLRLVQAVAAVREPHRAHAALADQAVERVAADRLSLERRLLCRP